VVIAEVIDHPNDISDVTAPGMRRNVCGECLLASLTHLPIAAQTAHAEQQAQEGPLQKRRQLAAEFIGGRCRSQ